jgi:hypothetical protein
MKRRWGRRWARCWWPLGLGRLHRLHNWRWARWRRHQLQNCSIPRLPVCFHLGWGGSIGCAWRRCCFPLCPNLGWGGSLSFAWDLRCSCASWYSLLWHPRHPYRVSLVTMHLWWHVSWRSCVLRWWRRLGPHRLRKTVQITMNALPELPAFAFEPSLMALLIAGHISTIRST